MPRVFGVSRNTILIALVAASAAVITYSVIPRACVELFAAEDDPLDAAGNYTNMFTGRKHPPDWSNRSKAWSQLPMYSDKERLRDATRSLKNNNVTFIVSGTGSGKTVIMPKLAFAYAKANKNRGKGVFEKLFSSRPPRVAVTNPKQLTTAANASYSAYLADVELGKEIGYGYRGSPDNASSSKTALHYVTDGYLLSLVTRDKELKDYDIVVIDEVHERPVPTDFLLQALGEVMKKRPEFRIVLMSATVDPAPFVNYYERYGLSVEVVEVSGQPNYPIERIHRPLKNMQNYMVAAVDAVMDVVKNGKSSGGILVFVPTTADTAKGCKLLSERCESEELGCKSVKTPAESVKCMGLHAKVTIQDRDAATSPSESDKIRHVVFSTNVAESSLTVKDLVYVIDTGKTTRVKYDANTDTVVSKKEWVTKGEAMQRMGRVGRKAPGTAILLYSASKFEKFEDFPAPSIATQDLTDYLFSMFSKDYNVYLRYSEVSFDDILKTSKDLITPVSDQQLSVFKHKLDFYRLLNKDGYLSLTGMTMYRLYQKIQVGFNVLLLLMAGLAVNNFTDVAKIAAVLETEAGVSLVKQYSGLNPCESSEHISILKSYDGVIKQIPEVKDKAASIQTDLIQVKRLIDTTKFPWNIVKRPSSLKCMFKRTSVVCPSDKASLNAECDSFYKAIFLAGLRNATVDGRRVFASTDHSEGNPPIEMAQRDGISVSLSPFVLFGETTHQQVSTLFDYNVDIRNEVEKTGFYVSETKSLYESNKKELQDIVSDEPITEQSEWKPQQPANNIDWSPGTTDYKVLASVILIIASVIILAMMMEKI